MQPAVHMFSYYVTLERYSNRFMTYKRNSLSDGLIKKLPSVCSHLYKNDLEKSSTSSITAEIIVHARPTIVVATFGLYVCC